MWVEDVVRKLAQDILNKGDFFSLATLDDGGVWVSDVFYVADESWNIYWLSALGVRHSMAIAQNPDAAGSIRITKTPQDFSEGLQIVGHVQVVPEEQVPKIEKLFLQKRGKEKKTGASRHAGKQAWYKLTPIKIRLSHEETFGLVKQDVTLS